MAGKGNYGALKTFLDFVQLPEMNAQNQVREEEGMFACVLKHDTNAMNSLFTLKSQQCAYYLIGMYGRCNLWRNENRSTWAKGNRWMHRITRNAIVFVA